MQQEGNGGKEFALTVSLFVKAERREEFLQVIRANQQGTLTAEPLAKVYEFGESTSVPNTFHFYEVYERCHLPENLRRARDFQRLLSHS